MNRKKSFANLLKITCVMVCSCIGTQLVWADKTNSESITDTAMGTDCSVRVFGSDGTAKDIMDMLSDIENKYLSWRIEGSDIANINENASENEPVMPSKWTYGYLENVLDLARKSRGAFNPTLGRVSQLWNLESDNHYIPSKSELTELLLVEQNISTTTVFLRQYCKMDCPERICLRYSYCVVWTYFQWAETECPVFKGNFACSAIQ